MRLSARFRAVVSNQPPGLSGAPSRGQRSARSRTPLRGLLGELEVAEEADQSSKHATPLVAEDLVETRCQLHDRRTRSRRPCSLRGWSPPSRSPRRDRRPRRRGSPRAPPWSRRTDRLSQRLSVGNAHGGGRVGELHPQSGRHAGVSLSDCRRRRRRPSPRRRGVPLGVPGTGVVPWWINSMYFIGVLLRGASSPIRQARGRRNRRLTRLSTIVDDPSSMTEDLELRQRPHRAARAHAAQRARALARGDGRTLRREPLDALADRARREQPDRGRPREDRDRPGRPARIAVRGPRPRRSGRAARLPARLDGPAVGLHPAQRLAERLGSPIQIVDVSFPPGAHVAYETGAREPRIHQQVWVLEGDRRHLGDETHRLATATASPCSSTDRSHSTTPHGGTRATPSCSCPSRRGRR